MGSKSSKDTSNSRSDKKEVPRGSKDGQTGDSLAQVRHISHRGIFQDVIYCDEGFGDLGYLPVEIQLNVLQFLMPLDALRVLSTSRSFFNFGMDPTIWNTYLRDCSKWYRSRHAVYYRSVTDNLSCCPKARVIERVRAVQRIVGYDAIVDERISVTQQMDQEVLQINTDFAMKQQNLRNRLIALIVVLTSIIAALTAPLPIYFIDKIGDMLMWLIGLILWPFCEQGMHAIFDSIASCFGDAFLCGTGRLLLHLFTVVIFSLRIAAFFGMWALFGVAILANYWKKKEFDREQLRRQQRLAVNQARQKYEPKLAELEDKLNQIRKGLTPDLPDSKRSSFSTRDSGSCIIS